MQSIKWPSDYPTHIKVPPKNAEVINELLYRLVRNDPPNSTDFVQTCKDPEQKHLHRREENFNKPGFYGTSFFKTPSRLEDMMLSHPNKFRSSSIGLGKVMKEHGVAARSENGHVSVWFYDGVYPQGFKLV
jgi:hypothetical protein